MSVPRVAEFSQELVPLNEILSYYRLSGPTDPPRRNTLNDPKRPYTWSNSVTSLDGVIHFLEPGANDVSDIALKSVEGVGHLSLADFRLLNAGWMMADAVLISGQIVRDEKQAVCRLHFDDMIEHREKVLLKPPYPIQLIISESCNMDYAQHPIFNTEGLTVIILTSEAGKIRGEQHFQSGRQANTSNIIHLNTTNTLPPPPNSISFVSFPKTNPDAADDNFIDLHAVTRWLHDTLNVQTLDVSAGGTIIRHFIDCQLLDEMRVTQTGQIAGFFNTNNEPRPTLFPRPLPPAPAVEGWLVQESSKGSGGGKKKVKPQYRSYTPNTSPLVAWKGIRLIGEHFVFLRGVLEYRHDVEK